MWKIKKKTRLRAKHLFILKESQGDSNQPRGLSPAQILRHYNFDRRFMGQGQTIAIISAFNYPTAKHDLDIFSRQFRLPKANLEIIYPQGVPPLDAGWAMESAEDIQWAHALAPMAKIMLVLAASNAFVDLFKAIDYAVKHGAQVVSMSWGGAEFLGETGWDNKFKHEGVTFVAAAGDTGGQTLFPSISQYVVSVGGTKLNYNSLGKSVKETGWVNGGGGPSIFVPMPTWQKTFGLDKTSGEHRATPDVSFDASRASRVSIYDSTPYNGVSGWSVMGGTSLGAPCWAGIIACINGQRIKPMKNARELLYRAAGKYSYTNPYSCFFDVTKGKAGSFSAKPGYDFVTGLGSPNIRNLIRFLSQEIEN